MSRYRAIALLIAGALAGAAPAETVRSGIQAWEKGDYKAAVEIWRPLADRGDPGALFNLAQAYRFGRGVSANMATAKGLFERAARGGHVESQTTLGLLLLQSGDQLDALQWLKQAADAGEPRALLVYGTALINGDGVTQDRLQGYAFVHASASSGLAAAKKSIEALDSLFSAADRRKALQTHQVKVRGKRAPTAASKARAAPAGEWRIQLGAFILKGAAESLYSRLSGSLGGRKAYYIPVGTATRLQVGPYATRAQASEACAKLKGQDCIVVRGR
jgi:TPR repeat protein